GGSAFMRAWQTHGLEIRRSLPLSSCVEIHARPESDGTMPALSPTRTSSSMRQWNSEPMIERPTKRSPVFSIRFACSTARRAEHPVPQGDRSILPGRIATAFSPTATPSTSPVERQTGRTDVVPLRQYRMPESELLVRCTGDLESGLGQLPCLVSRERKAE